MSSRAAHDCGRAGMPRGYRHLFGGLQFSADSLAFGEAWRALQNPAEGGLGIAETGAADGPDRGRGQNLPAGRVYLSLTGDSL